VKNKKSNNKGENEMKRICDLCKKEILEGEDYQTETRGGGIFTKYRHFKCIKENKEKMDEE